MSTVVPGDRLGHVSECAAGAGTYERQGHIYASLVGQVERVSVGEEGGGVTMTVIRSGDAGVLRLPEVGSVVTGRVTKINARFASVDIVCSQGRPFASSFGGVIRRENVRATEIDRWVSEAAAEEVTGRCGGRVVVGCCCCWWWWWLW